MNLNKEAFMAETSTYQVADWNGQSGERWVANQARLDHMLAAFGEAAIAVAAPAARERVLDVGCGAGPTSFALAACVRAARSAAHTSELQALTRIPDSDFGLRTK